MANKRPSDAAGAPSRPSKKRKSAEASKAKIKEIAEAEEIADAEELVEMKAKAKIEVRDDEEDVEEVPRVVAPGFRVWNTTSKMTAGGELSEASMLDTATQKYSMILDIQNEEAFTLKPLVITQGPYKGCRVFMLESGVKFRFFDFPAEIRNLVYSFLVEEDGPIKMDTHKVVNEPRRPVRASYTSPHPGLKKDRKTGKWPVQGPSSLTLLRASKKALGEVAPLLYGNNRFIFSDLGDFKVFLDRIGSMSQYLRDVEITEHTFQTSKASSVFGSLKDAVSLRSLSFHYHALSLYDSEERYYWRGRIYTSAEGLASHAYLMMKAVHQKHKDAEDGFNVLDILKVRWERCSECKPLEAGFAADNDCKGSNAYYPRDNVKCKDSDEHCKKLEEKIRKKLAGLLKIGE